MKKLASYIIFIVCLIIIINTISTVASACVRVVKVKKPAITSLYGLVNKKYGLHKNYQPKDLVIPRIIFSGESKEKYMRKDAAIALEKLVRNSRKYGLRIYGTSAFRTYEKQKQVYEGYIKTMGQKEADRASAKPGYSEHQTGLAIDVFTPSSMDYLLSGITHTREGKWLEKNAYKYGFVIRYPKGKERITGYKYEPWHLRYLGKNIAKKMYVEGWTYEEYCNKYYY